MAIKTIDESSLVSIASAIRAKLKTTDTYYPNEMGEAINSITVGEPDWSEIGYSSAPSGVILGFNYAKTIMDDWEPNPEDGHKSLNNKFRDDTKLMFFPNVDTSKYTACHYMFNGCRGLVSISDDLDFTSITQCNNMFNDCTAIRSIKIGPFGNGTVTNIDAHSIFQNLKSLEVVELDCDNLANLGWSFSGCNQLKSVTLTNTDHITTMQRAFEACERYPNSLSLSLPACTNCEDMFCNFAQLSTPTEDQIITLNIPVATTLAEGFYQGNNAKSSIKEIHLTTGNALTNLEKCFMQNTELTTVTITNTSHVQRFKNMFTNCKRLENIPLMDGSACIDGGMEDAFLFCGIDPTDGITPLLTDTSLDNILRLCASATNESHKTLTYVGWRLSNMQTTYRVAKMSSLPHYQDFLDAGWELGYDI